MILGRPGRPLVRMSRLVAGLSAFVRAVLALVSAPLCSPYVAGFRRFDIIWQAIPAVNDTYTEESAPVLVVPTLGQ
jgi:hypothetical protein